MNNLKIIYNIIVTLIKIKIMKINILLPFKEKFDKQKASSVSITVSNNMHYSNYLKDILVFGQQTVDPLFPGNFVGINYSIFSFKSKNNYLADHLSKNVIKTNDENQLIEVHNRPYLVKRIKKKVKSCPISLFLHNNPKEMKGAKTVKEREELILKCEAIFCVSKFIKKQFLDGINKNIEKIHVLYNGVDRKQKKIPKKKKEVLFVGRIVEEKGVEIYVNTISSIAQKFPDWTFNLIGSSKLGEIDHNSFFANKIKKNFKKIGTQANYYGFKNKNFVDDKMKSASIIIIPSLWEEPFGLVAAEAMSYGAAIIASNRGALSEIIGNNGVLIDKIDYKKLKSALTNLLSNKSQRVFFQKKSWKNFNFSSITSSEKLDSFRKAIFQKYY